VVDFGLAVLAFVLFLIVWAAPEHRASRALGVAGALALLAGAVWSAWSEDRWWPVLAGLGVAAVWIAVQERDRRRAPR
jgi:hypothetical protein